LIVDLLRKELSKDGMETALSKACQISIDSATLSLSCEHMWGIVEQALVHCFGAHLLQLSSASSGSYNTKDTGGNRSKFYQIYDDILSLLRTLTSQTQDLMFELLSNKIDGLLESLVFIDLEPNNLLSTNGQYQSNFSLNAMNSQYVHECVESIIEFLSVTFMWLTHLPQTIRESIHFISCSKVSIGMLHYLLEKAARVNIYGLISLDADVKRLTQFADSCGIADLRSCFEELAQTVRLMLHPDLSQLIDNSALRHQHFPLSSTLKIAQLLDKVSQVVVGSQLSVHRLHTIYTCM
jgi:hypothetical protein